MKDIQSTQNAAADSGRRFKRVVIMGASSGIGLRLAEELASRGVPVGLAARHTASLLKLKEKYPENVFYESIDVTKPAAVKQLDSLIAQLGGMDIYVHVAGIGSENLTLEPETEVNMLKTNVCGFARMLCAAYRYFRANSIKGQIAAITSVAGTNGIARLSAYSASKAFGQRYLVALEQLSRNENAGISFTDIRPGWTETPLLTPGCKYPMLMTLDYVVPQIIKAIVRKRRVAVIDWRWNIVVGLWRLLPRLHLDSHESRHLDARRLSSARRQILSRLQNTPRNPNLSGYYSAYSRVFL